jgi:hypothetical protein
MPVVVLFTEASLFVRRIACGFGIFGAIMPHGINSGKALKFSVKRND